MTFDTDRYRKRPMYRYTTGAAGMREQMKRAETIQAIWHRKLIEAGYEWDGMDGYTAPAGTDADDMRRLFDEALNEAHEGEKP